MQSERQLTVDEACAEIARLDIGRYIDKVIIHHCWEPPADKYRGIATVTATRRFHQKRWPNHNDNGYHIMVAPNGDIFFCCPFNKVGAHARGHNSRSIGVSYIADFGGPPGGLHPDGRPTPLDNPDTYAGLVIGQIVVAALCKRFDLDAGDVYFHRDFSTKTCPGTLMDREKYREAVEQFMNGSVKVVLLTGSEDPDILIARSNKPDELRALFGGEEHILLDAFDHLDDQGKVYLRKNTTPQVIG